MVDCVNHPFCHTPPYLTVRFYTLRDVYPHEHTENPPATGGFSFYRQLLCEIADITRGFRYNAGITPSSVAYTDKKAVATVKRDIRLWQFSGFAITSFFGTVLHFLYDWTGQNTATALISGVNESTWEHMKLLFFPLFAFALVQNRFFKDIPAFWCVKLIGTVTGLLLIPVLFYTYNGVFGTSPDAVNIAIFFLTAATTFWLETRLLQRKKVICRRPYLALTLLCLIGVLFFVFTFFTPTIPLFQDPISGTYGI